MFCAPGPWFSWPWSRIVPLPREPELSMLAMISFWLPNDCPLRYGIRDLSLSLPIHRQPTLMSSESPPISHLPVVVFHPPCEWLMKMLVCALKQWPHSSASLSWRLGELPICSQNEMAAKFPTSGTELPHVSLQSTPCFAHHLAPSWVIRTQLTPSLITPFLNWIWCWSTSEVANICVSGSSQQPLQRLRKRQCQMVAVLNCHRLPMSGKS